MSRKPSSGTVAFACMLVFLLCLIGGMAYFIYDDYYGFANEAKEDLVELDPQFYKMRSGYYDTSRQSGLVVWDRLDGSTCETRYVRGELIYPPIRDCYFTSGPSGGRWKSGRWVE